VSYVKSKQKMAASLGIKLDLISLDEKITQKEIEAILADLSDSPSVHGILLESPLPDGLNESRALSQIIPIKDVDGLTPANLGLVTAGRESEAILAATPQACIELIETQVELIGKKVGLVGCGRTVGRPLTQMLLNRHATLTVCHSFTQNIPEALANCEVIIVAVGQPFLIGSQHVKTGQIVIDAGINLVDNLTVGDVDANSVRGKVAALTPVPGGVGPLTSAIVFRNLIKAIHLQLDRS
jgi:methylenetetrahydrofolate dehydrogenase (NADP+)/methenyltetrahydrofolate cyclohydrolase